MQGIKKNRRLTSESESVENVGRGRLMGCNSSENEPRAILAKARAVSVGFSIVEAGFVIVDSELLES
jgi:hypothetical protein